MKIAQVAPLMESVPPLLYGGTERVVSYLTEELVAQGHEVTLFASGDSQTAATLVSGAPRALRLDSAVRDPLPHYLIMLDQVRCRAAEFDVVHFHIDLLQYLLLPGFPARTLTTLHGRLDLPDLMPFYRRFPEHALVSISRSQRAPMPPVHWLGTVLHGLPADLHHLGSGDGGYLAFLGRISPEKQPDQAIAIAERAGMKLKIAAKVDVADREYFEARIKPLLASPWIEFIGEIGEEEKQDFLGNARALLFPIDWPEPFGLVMIEAMACGTPVIAFDCGSVPEVLEDGLTGMLVRNTPEAVAAVDALDRLDRRRIRARFEERFTAARMAEDYLALYRKLTP